MSRCSRGSSRALLVLVTFCTSIAGIFAQTGAGGETVPVELSTVGLDGRTGTPIVVLREPVSGGVLPIWVGVMEAQAIALALHGVVTPRPMTHDLMASLITELRAEVDEVVVTDLRNNTYFGMVRLKVAGERKIRDIDSRPSDALALAVRTGAPIRVVKKILAIAPEFEFIAPDGPNQVVQAMGMTVVLATPSLRRQFKLGDLPGIVVTSAYGAARDKGLRRGDVITSINGKAVEEPAEFFDAVRASKPRAPVRVTYWRNGETKTIELPADLPPANPGKRGRVTA
jgi:bifunctional DNase/RNase